MTGQKKCAQKDYITKRTRCTDIHMIWSVRTSRGCRYGPKSFLVDGWSTGFPSISHPSLETAVTSAPVSSLKGILVPLMEMWAIHAFFPLFVILSRKADSSSSSSPRTGFFAAHCAVESSGNILHLLSRGCRSLPQRPHFWVVAR